MSLRRLSGSGDTIMVQEADSTVDATVTTLDFGAGFDVTSSPAGEANIALDLSEVAGGGDLAFSGNTPTILFPLDDEAAAAATDDVLRSKVSGDTQYRYILHADGKMEWGPGGSTAPDTNFRRVSAGVLGTEASLRVNNDDSYFGAGAIDGAGPYAVVGSLGTNDAWLDARGSATDAYLVLRSQGATAVQTRSSLGLDIRNTDASVGNLIDMHEMTAPGAPGADGARIYAVDNGGKTQLVVRFNTGAVQVLATEP